MTITIKLETDNDAFVGAKGEEVRRIIKEWLHKGRLSDANLRDYNGNTVGTVTVEDED